MPEPAPDQVPVQPPDGERPGGAATDPTHPLLVAVAPLLDRVAGRFVEAAEAAASDVPLVWQGETIAAVRLADVAAADASPQASVASLDTLLDEVAGELGGPLEDMGRAGKQNAVRLLEERGAFEYRRSVEAVAEALGVTRFTVYNYLNRVRG